MNGIRLGACSAGIYRRSRPDLVLISLEPGATAAGAFTRNAFCAAPVTVARKHIERGSPRYCLINAGNANAGTGEQGLRDALTACGKVAELGDCRPEQVLPFSTGVIGEFLPVNAICTALPGLFGELREDAWLDCARAIMTTDTIPKGASRQIEIDGVDVTVTGIAKGAGMIHPDMATMLCFVGTDAGVAPAALNRILAHALEESFNSITVDGDTSTNDSLMLLATGRSRLSTISGEHSAGAKLLREAVTDVCRQLAHAVVRDGEGATKFITVTVEEGRSTDECRQVARSVATSPLVKTAFYASDPNWGRILAAVGRSGVPDLDIGRTVVKLGDVTIVAGGGRAPGYTESAGQKVMSQQEVTILIRLGRGRSSATVYTCDLSEEYVRINAEYRT